MPTPNTSPQQPAPRRRRKFIALAWTIFFGLVAAVTVFFVLAYNGVIGYMPPVESLRNPQDKFATIIYTADGVEMGRYFRNSGNRIYADLDEISPNVINALIATEDSRFMDHSGIDARAITRALVKTVLMGQRNAGGGSTLTQQLAKQLYTPPSDGALSRAVQKPIEWMIAVKLERYYSKEEILKMYLNQFDFLYNAVGIKSAAKVYFNKDAADLNVEEAATLVGMVKNPSYFNPVRKPERTRDRRNVVLEQMYKADMLTRAELDSLSALPLTLDFHRVDHKEGLAPYFREELRRYLTARRPVRSDYREWERQRFVDDSIAWDTNPLYGWIEKNPKADGTKYDIYSDGLKIYTTIDSRMQTYAEEAVADHMRSLQRSFNREKRGSSTRPYSSNPAELSAATRAKLIEQAVRQSERHRIARIAGRSAEEIDVEFNTPVEMTVFSYEGPVDTVMTPMDSILYTKGFLRTGFMSMDPLTGYVKAYVGGPDFRFFQYDMVSTGRRQIGSTIKPFLYTYAMESDFTPCDMMLNEQPTFYDESGRPWSPRNSGHSRVGEMVDLRWALTNSNNWISARLMAQLSPAELVKRMHSYGITGQLPAVMSLCLGPCEVSVKEMVTAYTAFANKGMRTDPLFVTAIADANGNIISEFSPTQTEVITEKGYYKILSMLLNVVDSGTGNRLRRPPYNITAQMGGKTGTTNFNSDGWFMGFTPDLVSGVWVGGEERYIHFNSMAEGQGASMALPIYGKYISRVYADPTLPYDQSKHFQFPAGINLCEGGFTGPEEVETAEEGLEGIFD
ncbi:MAG: transglycosylase domain-containing protein [Bacteroides sp.]|nr:transglycosylase domain-containing protein [Bacteroides sp.]MCM1094972.1 transglycosylase domain-containing protein [Terasakiella sp.]